MIVLLGDTSSKDIVALIRQYGFGRMWSGSTPKSKDVDGEPWAFDNGAFSDWMAKRDFRGERFLFRLKQVFALPSTPLFGVVPDKVADPESLAFSLGWLDRLRDFTWPWYLAVQDGMTPVDVAPHLGEFDGIFLGGTTQFKATGPKWCRLAHDHGKGFHYGRCATRDRFYQARAMGADSVDSSQPLWSKDHMRRFLEYATTNDYQEELHPC